MSESTDLPENSNPEENKPALPITVIIRDERQYHYHAAPVVVEPDKKKVRWTDSVWFKTVQEWIEKRITNGVLSLPGIGYVYDHHQQIFDWIKHLLP